MTPGKVNTQAFLKGYRAYLTKTFKTSNPFNRFDQEAFWLEWNAGWDCAEADDLN